MRTGGRLRVVLDAERRDVQALQPFHHVIVEADVTDPDPAELAVDLGIQRRLHRESVIVCGDLDLPVERSCTGWLMPRCP